ncbi:MAG: hypothetical protein Fur0022_07710 [Anaerolineales bacterium]
MLRLLADENLNGYIMRGLLRHRPEIDMVRVQDVGLSNVDDPMILAWAAEQRRIMVTHDQATMPDFAFGRVAEGHPMPGVFILNDQMSLKEAIDELLFLDECSEQEDWNNRVIYLPL